jgi:hypothetical protein
MGYLRRWIEAAQEREDKVCYKKERKMSPCQIARHISLGSFKRASISSQSHDRA